MPLRFIIGRAGSGKTAHCLSEIRSSLRASPLDGPPLLLIVPQQAGLQMERALVADDGLAAYHRCRVLSFDRLARWILAEQGEAPPAEISPYRRLLLVARVLADEKPALRFFHTVRRTVGFQQELAKLFQMLLQHGATPDGIRTAVDAPGRLTQTQRHRLADIADLFAAYRTVLGETRVDPAEICRLAANRLSANPRGAATLLGAAHLWVDGFAGLSGAEASLMYALAAVAERVDITLLLDPDSPVLGPAGGPIEDWDLFAPAARTYHALRAECHDRGISVEPPMLLRPPAPPRFAKSPALTALERNLFASTGKSAAMESVGVLSCATRRVEVDEVGRRIRSAVTESGGLLRYRDIAVITRDLEIYADFVAASFSALGIPCFIDRRERVTHHPLVDLVRALVGVAVEDFSIDAMRALLKTGFLPASDDGLDELENAILAFGVTGRGRWTGPAWTLARSFSSSRSHEAVTPAEQASVARINKTRDAVVGAVAPWTDAVAAERNPSASQLCRWMFDALDALDVQGRLERLAVDAEAEGEIGRANLHRQLYGELLQLLDDFHEALGDAPVSVAAWSGVLEAALAYWTVGLAPPTLDQVLVGQIDRSRHPDVKQVYLIGFNQGVFPSPPVAETILTDPQRDALCDTGIDLGPGRVQGVFDERFLAYVAMTRASESLCVSFARADESGRELEPSTYLDALMAAVPGVRMEHVDESSVRPPFEIITTPARLVAALGSELSRRPNDPTDDADAAGRERFNDLYEVTREHAALAAALRRALSVTRASDTRLTPEAAGKLFPPNFAISLSALETYAACPFQYFARYGLRLEKRRTHELAAVDIGTLNHAILETLFSGMIDDGVWLEAIDDDALLARLTAAIQRTAADLHDDIVVTPGRRAYLLRRREIELRRWLDRHRFAVRQGKFRPARVEASFGLAGREPPIEIETPNGRRVRLHGRIDRVDLAELGSDLAGIVIDYKRPTGAKLDLVRVLHGLDLQLVGYLLALDAMGESLTGRPIRPVGAFYSSLTTPYKSVDRPGENDGEDVELAKRQKLRGVFDEAALPALDANIPPGDWSSVVQVYVKKDGEIGNEAKADLVRTDSFAAVLERTRHRIGELADALLDGRIDVRPYLLKHSMPCDWCDYRAVCRFEIETGELRPLPTMERLAVIDEMRGGGAE